MKQELGISFRGEQSTVAIIGETARRYGLTLDMLGVYDDLGDMSPFFHLLEAARNLSSASETKLGPVGVAIPKHRSMVDVVGYMSILQDLRPNRVFLGLVPGAWLKTIGLENASVSEMKEAIESARYLMRQETSGYTGKHFSIQQGFALPHAKGECPILVGAWGPRFAALAGEVAQEIKIGGSANPDIVPIIQERLQIGATKAGRTINDIGIVLGAVTVIDEDRNVALSIARKKALVYINIIGDKDPTVQRDFPEEITLIRNAMQTGDSECALKYLPESLARRFVFAGAPSDIITHVEHVLATGVKRIEFGTPHGVSDELVGVDLLVKKVFPHFRK